MGQLGLWPTMGRAVTYTSSSTLVLCSVLRVDVMQSEWCGPG